MTSFIVLLHDLGLHIKNATNIVTPELTSCGFDAVVSNVTFISLKLLLDFLLIHPDLENIFALSTFFIMFIINWA